MSRSDNALIRAAAQDLAWFKNENYLELKRFSALDWARLVGDRLNLHRAILGGDRQAVEGPFEALKANPLKWLGSDVRYVGADHAANTATVKSINLRRLRFLSDELDNCCTSDQFGGINSGECADAIVDELVGNNPTSSFERFAHVMVSVDAPKAQIIRDFGSWLDGWLDMRTKASYKEGDYLKKARDQWIPHCAVQYFDLNIYEALAGKDIPSELRWGALFPGLQHEVLESKKKKARSAATLLFSADTYQLLRHLAYEASHR